MHCFDNLDFPRADFSNVGSEITDVNLGEFFECSPSQFANQRKSKSFMRNSTQKSTARYPC